jgi:hypothetical protein
MILVNEPQGYRVCLECHSRFDEGDEPAWMTQHIGCKPDPRRVAA